MARHGITTGIMAMTALCAASGLARADDHCVARVLSEVPAMEAPEEVKAKGGSFGPITTVKVRRDSGRMYYCTSTSYCYDSNAFQIVSPCRMKLDKAWMGSPFFVYSAR